MRRRRWWIMSGWRRLRTRAELIDAEETLKRAFRADVRPGDHGVAARRMDLAEDPLEAFRASGYHGSDFTGAGQPEARYGVVVRLRSNTMFKFTVVVIDRREPVPCRPPNWRRRSH